MEEERFLFGRDAGDGPGGDMPDGELALGGDAMLEIGWRGFYCWRKYGLIGGRLQSTASRSRMDDMNFPAQMDDLIALMVDDATGARELKHASGA